MNDQLLQISDDEKLLVISILDPLSSKLPETITSNWNSVTGVYQLARKFCHRIHLKREKVYMDLDDKTWSFAYISTSLIVIGLVDRC